MRLSIALPLFALATTAFAQSPCSCLANSPPGTLLPLGDDTSIVISLPFSITFNGASYNQVSVGSNGYLVVGAGAANDFSPTESEMLDGDPKIALLWDDWAPNNAAAGDGVYYACTTDTACVTFLNVPSFGGAELLNGEVLFAPGSEVVINLDASSIPQGGDAIVGVSAGGGAAANQLDLSALPNILGATGYEIFNAGNPLDLVGFLQLTPLNAADYALSQPAIATCPPQATYPPLYGTLDYGVGCSGAAPTAGLYYEDFAAGAIDVAGLSVKFTATGSSTYDVGVGAGFDNSYAPGDAIVLGDDDVLSQALGFAMNYNGVAVTDVGVCSNGFVWMDGSTSGDFSDSLAEFLSEGPRCCVLWDDLQPDAAGTVYWTQGAGFAMVTYEDVPYWGSTDLVTAQCKFFDNGDIEFNYGALALNPDSALIGLTGGAGGIDLGPSDVSAATGMIDITTAGGGLPLAHSGIAPALGGNYELVLENLPATTNIAAFVIGFQQDSTPLDSIGMPGCFDLVVESASLVQVVAPGTASVNAFLSIPHAVKFYGLNIYSQGAAFAPGINPLGVLSSNGVEATLGI